MKSVITVVALSALTFTAAQAVSFDPETGMIQETQKEIDDRQDKVGVDNWAYANQANGTANSALYFANKNHAALKETNAAIANQQQHLEVHDQAMMVLAKGLDTHQQAIGENTRRLNTDDRQLDHLQQVANSQGADIRQNTVGIKQASASASEAKDLAQTANDVNASQDAQIKEEVAERIKGYTDTNKRVDGAYDVLGNHEGRIVTLEGKEQATSDRVNVIRNEQARQANKQVETDYRISQTKTAASRANAGVSRVDTKVDDEHRTNENQQVWITDVQTKADTAVSKIPVFEKGIDDNSKRIDGLDRKTDQTADDASYARGKADFADGSASRAHERLDGVNTTLKGVQSTQSDHETRITNNAQNISALGQEVDTKASKASVTQVQQNLNTTNQQVNTNTQNIERVGQTAGQALEVGNTAYHNTQVNARNIDSVDRASIERSKAAVFEANAYTDRSKAQLEQRMDQQYNKVRREAFAGVASVAAMSGMPFLQGTGTSIAVGTGFYKGASAAAMGVQYQPSETDAFRVSGSISNGGDGAVSAGFAHRF